MVIIKNNNDDGVKIYCKFNKENAPISITIGKMFKDFLNNKNISEKKRITHWTQKKKNIR